VLGINHQSPLIYCLGRARVVAKAGNQSPIPFDILSRPRPRGASGWESITNPLWYTVRAGTVAAIELGINHQSPLIYWCLLAGLTRQAGNQSPIPFDILRRVVAWTRRSWESITNPLWYTADAQMRVDLELGINHQSPLIYW